MAEEKSSVMEDLLEEAAAETPKRPYFIKVCYRPAYA